MLLFLFREVENQYFSENMIERTMFKNEIPKKWDYQYENIYNGFEEVLWKSSTATTKWFRKSYITSWDGFM